MAAYKLSLLGPAQFSRNNTSVELKSLKGTALLAYLAVTGTTQARERLADLLWPDSLPGAARKNMRNTLWAVRKAFGDDLLLADGDRLSLNPAAWLDVRVLEEAVKELPGGQVDHLAAAADLYRGPLLAGLALADAPDFELWLTAERERLEQLYLRALEALIAFQRRQNNWREVIATARRALATDNLQEPMHQAIIEAHARLGERVEALRQYDLLQATLAQELGVEPLPDTRQLRQAILNGTLEPLPAQVPVPVQPRSPTRRMAQTPLPFVGRQSELAALDQALAAAAAGHIQVVLLTGELGIGKSRLWQEWSTKVDPTVILLETRCLDTTQALPFAPLINLFRQRPCLQQLLAPNSPLAPVWLAELTPLLPEIKQHRPELAAPPTLPPEEERRRLFEAFSQVLLTLPSRPLALFIDDLHWLDQSTLDWLIYLVDRLSEHPLLLAGAYRPDEASPHLSRVIAAWSRQGVARHVPLPRLTSAESGQLLAALADGRVDQVGQLHAKSAGNPYFLIELSRAGADDTPPGLAELIRARLKGLPDAARQVLQAAAVLETGFDFATLRRTSGRGEEETLNALDALLQAAVLVEANNSYDFAHPLVAAVVRHDLGLARRSFLHRRAAEALETIYANQLEVIAGQLAAHYNQAGQPAQAAHYAELAAARSLKLTATTEAIALYRQALQLEDTPERHLGLAQALIAGSDLEAARQELHLAATAFEQARNSVGMGQAYLDLALSYMASGDGERVQEWANKAATALGSPPDPVLHTRLHNLLAAGGLVAGRPLAWAEAHLLEAIQLASAHNLPAVAGVGRFELGNLLAQRGDLPGALEAFAAALALAQSSGDLFQEVLAHNNLAYHALLAEDLDTAQTHIAAGLALAQSHELFTPRQYLYSTRGEIALAQGAFDEAEQWFNRALAEAKRNNNQLQAANIQANLGLVARARGALDEAKLLLEEARHAITHLTAPHLQTQLDLWLAEVYWQRGERAAAQQALAQAQARLSGSERRGLQAWAARVQATMNSN